MSETPRIYAACLASYNNGSLYGEWIDADQGADDIQTEITEMLRASPEPGAEEWAIHDYEGFCGLSIGEYENIESVSLLAQLITKHGAAFACYLSDKGAEYATEEHFQADYSGEHENEESFAEDWFRECNEIPKELDDYIDWERVASDLFISDFMSQKYEGKTYVSHRS